MTNQNPWDVLTDVAPQKKAYHEVEERFPELAPVQADQFQSEWSSLPSAPETGFEKAGRIGGQLTTRALEQVYGLPGDIEKFGRTLLNVPAKKLPYMTEGFKQIEPFVSKENILPTSQELRQRTKELGKGKFEPKSEWEEIAGNIVGKAVVAPGGPWTKLATSVGSEAAKEIAGALGGSENTKALVDMGTSFAISRFAAPTIRNYWGREYNLATRAIPQNAVVPAANIQATLTAVRNRVQAGGWADWKAGVIRQINHLENNINQGVVHVRDIDRAVHDLNRQIYAAGTTPQAIRELQTLARGGRRLLRHYGRQNPVFAEHWVNANSAYAGWAANRAATNFMQRHIGKFTAGGGTGALLTLMTKGPEITGKTVAALAATYGIAKASEFTSRVFANRVTRRYYLNALVDASRQNAPQMITNLNKLDQELKKEAKSKKS